VMLLRVLIDTRQEFVFGKYTSCTIRVHQSGT
jgi:hypothetical protein